MSESCPSLQMTLILPNTIRGDSKKNTVSPYTNPSRGTSQKMLQCLKKLGNKSVCPSCLYPGPLWSGWVESAVERVRMYVSVRNVKAVCWPSAGALCQEFYIFIGDRGMSEDDPRDLSVDCQRRNWGWGWKISRQSSADTTCEMLKSQKKSCHITLN